jgi:hypothetical protein
MGATVMTLYKGPIVDFISGRGQSHHKTSAESADQHWVTGTLMLLGSCCGWAAFFILQVSLINSFIHYTLIHASFLFLFFFFFFFPIYDFLFIYIFNEIILWVILSHLR